jgi:GTP-binding protein HflX
MALITDTVGFIQKLPTNLVAAFRATLEEIAEADLLIHVVDVTHPSAQLQAAAVLETLEEIEADHIPVLTVLNKIDRLNEPEGVKQSLEGFTDTVAVSALHGRGMEDLLAGIHRKLFEAYERVQVELPFAEGALIALFHEQGQVEHIEHTRKGQIITGRMPVRLVARFRPFEVNGKSDNLENYQEE